MKKILYVVIIIVVIGLGVFYFYQKSIINKKTVVPVNNQTTNQIANQSSVEPISDGQYCFSRSQEATTTEPYQVKENIVFNIKGDVVTGTKNGTQNGPDMTNGYTGDLKGSISGNNMELTYSYTIEGSNGKELEVYQFQNGLLIKKRWVLVDEGGVLMPDKIEDPKIIYYTEDKCQ
jgi:hypothetical protein